MNENGELDLASANDVERHERVIRVFVSSTFRDFSAERDWLVKRVFPQLREICERRGVVWSEVDLRWGVTDEERAEGRVLPICLEEIRRCRPYFIGLLGERYGFPCRCSWLHERGKHIDRDLLRGLRSHTLFLHRKLLSGAGARAFQRRWPICQWLPTIARSSTARSAATDWRNLQVPFFHNAFQTGAR